MNFIKIKENILPWDFIGEDPGWLQFPNPTEISSIFQILMQIPIKLKFFIISKLLINNKSENSSFFLEELGLTKSPICQMS